MVFAGFTAISAGWYFIRGRKEFKGPVATGDEHSMEIEGDEVVKIDGDEVIDGRNVDLGLEKTISSKREV